MFSTQGCFSARGPRWSEALGTRHWASSEAFGLAQVLSGLPPPGLLSSVLAGGLDPDHAASASRVVLGARSHPSCSLPSTSFAEGPTELLPCLWLAGRLLK